MAQTEAGLTASIIRRLQSEPGIWCMKIHGGNMQRAGVPDILGAHYGRMFGLEVKSPGALRGVTRLQRYEMQKMANAGVLVAVVESVQDALTVLGI